VAVTGWHGLHTGFAASDWTYTVRPDELPPTLGVREPRRPKPPTLGPGYALPLPLSDEAPPRAASGVTSTASGGGAS